MTGDVRMRFVVPGVLLPWAIVGFVARFAYRLAAQHGHDLLEIEALQQQVRQLGGDPIAQSSSISSAGLPVGSKLQDFELPDLDGRSVTLHELHGQRLLLIFFDPHCPFSTALLPQLATLSPDLADGQPLPLILTTGDLQENRDLFATHDVRLTVLRQDVMEVAALYRVNATPSGYLVDEHGVTASHLALGAEALLALAGTPDVAAAAASGTTSQAHQSLARSRILRTGLKAGTSAPDFHLPRLDGGEVSLSEYRGRRVLLVFSDPACGPCSALAPELERIHREFPDLQVLMISRGEIDANRQKVMEHRLTFPIVLQRHWDTSRDYGMFATPIAYLIDEAGVIAAPVAVGPGSIISLASAAGREEVAVS